MDYTPVVNDRVIHSLLGWTGYVVRIEPDNGRQYAAVRRDDGVRGSAPDGSWIASQAQLIPVRPSLPGQTVRRGTAQGVTLRWVGQVRGWACKLENCAEIIYSPSELVRTGAPPCGGFLVGDRVRRKAAPGCEVWTGSVTQVWVNGAANGPGEFVACRPDGMTCDNWTIDPMALEHEAAGVADKAKHAARIDGRDAPGVTLPEKPRLPTCPDPWHEQPCGCMTGWVRPEEEPATSEERRFYDHRDPKAARASGADLTRIERRWTATGSGRTAYGNTEAEAVANWKAARHG